MVEAVVVSFDVGDLDPHKYRGLKVAQGDQSVDGAQWDRTLSLRKASRDTRLLPE